MNYAVIMDLLLLGLTLTALFYCLRLHALLRAGELGRAWRFIIIGIALLALRELFRLSVQLYPLSFAPILERMAEGGFMALLCYALWRQWTAFDFLQRGRPKRVHWSRLAQTDNKPSPSESTTSGSEEERKERWRINP